MSRSRIQLAGGERAAFEKLVQALRHGQEAATELGVYRSDNGWAAVGMQLEKMHNLVQQLNVAAVAKRVRH
jgi:hypothetical protein